jgi:hypothetical protein
VAQLTNQLGSAWGVTQGRPVVQYLAWSDHIGLFRALESQPCILEDLAAETGLNLDGADVLTSILVSLGLLRRTPGGLLALSETARESFLPDSPYYVGEVMFLDCDRELYATFTDPEPHKNAGRTASTRWTIPARLRVQHARNFAPSVVAARTGGFEGVRHLIDIAGGSGVLAIPLALDDPGMRITLVERPEVLEHIQPFLDAYGVGERVALVGMDLLTPKWDLPPCDGIFFGNLFHANSDTECRRFARQSFELIEPGGRAWVHEVLFNENRDGPLLAALWNANMFMRRPGARQRTESEIAALLTAAGFVNCRRIPTTGHFSLVVGEKAS